MRILLRKAAVPLALVALVIASRVPFMTHDLWAWDSVLYARALEQGFHVDYSLADQRPQPPGYLLYVAAAAALRLLLGDSNSALVALSVAASALGALAVFLLARRLAGTAPALFVAAAFAANPLVWTYGEVAYPYAVLGLLSVTIASLFLTSRDGSDARVVAASFAFGMLAGFRQDVALLLGPLWLWLVWPRRWRVRLAAAGAGALAGLAWLVPTMLLSGGAAAYVGALLRQTDTVGATYSVAAQGLPALAYNVSLTLDALGWGLLGVAVILAGLLLGELVLRRPRPRADRPPGTASAAFFAVWLLPGLLFYSAVHIGEWGYVLSILPAFYVLTATLLARPVAALRASAPRWAAVAAVVALAPGLLFVFGDGRFSAGALAAHDRALEARVAYVRAHFPAETTIVLAREDYLTVRYYLPEYRTWFYDPEPYHDAARHRRTMRAGTIVLFTEGLVPRQGVEVQRADAAPGVRIAWFAVEPGSILEFYREHFTVKEQR